MKIKNGLLVIYNGFINIYLKIKKGILQKKDRCRVRRYGIPHVASVEESIRKIVEEKCSVSRFGDGEIKLVAGCSISFQACTPQIKDRLREVLGSSVQGHMVCLADIFENRERYDEKSNLYWKNHLLLYRKVWYRYIDIKKDYYNASMTRQYMSLKDKKESISIFEMIKEVWKDRDLLIVEGEKTRMGIGNDLFEQARSIKRILGPSSHAFGKYEELLAAVRRFDKQILVLLALGPCATVMAFDLHREGYQAVDIGHIDVEYEWYLQKAARKVPLKNKIVQEALTDRIEDVEDQAYLEQIVERVVS